MPISPIWPAATAVNAEGSIEFHGRTAESLLDEFGSPLYLIDTDSTVRAGKALAEIHRLPVNNIYNHQPLCQMQYIFNRIRQTLLNSRLHHKSIHDDFYIMLDVLI